MTMIPISDTAQSIMKNHLNHIGGDLDKHYTKKTQAKINETMRLAQIDLIRSYWDDMDDETRARAKRTLDQIGGDDYIRGSAL